MADEPMLASFRARLQLAGRYDLLTRENAHPPGHGAFQEAFLGRPLQAMGGSHAGAARFHPARPQARLLLTTS